MTITTSDAVPLRTEPDIVLARQQVRKLTITAGFMGMNLALFVLGSVVSRAISFMIVGVLFRLFGAPIKRFIDKYLGLVTAGFVVLVIGGFLALTLLEGDRELARDNCSAAALDPRIA